MELCLMLFLKKVSVFFCVCDPRQTPQSIEFSRQEHWSGLPFPSEDFLYPAIKSRFPTLQANSLPSEPSGKPNSHNKQKLIKVDQRPKYKS